MTLGEIKLEKPLELQRDQQAMKKVPRMKKIISILLVLVIAFTIAVPTFAVEYTVNPGHADKDNTYGGYALAATTTSSSDTATIIAISSITFLLGLSIGISATKKKYK